VKSKNPVIILLEHREEYQAIYGMNLTLYLGVDVKVATTIKSAMDLIEEYDPVLLFVNNKAYGQDMGEELWKLFDQKQLKVPLFVLGNAKVPLDEVTVFDSKIQLRDVLRSMAKTLNITATKMMEKEYPEYFALPSEFVVPRWQTSIEIFIKNFDDYEIYFEPDDVITSYELEILEKDNNFQLYVDRHDRLKFVNSLTGQICAKLNDPNLSPKERIEVSATAYQMVMEQSRKIGIGESTLELANSCIESMTKLATEIPKLDDLLKVLLSDRTGLRYKHSLLINYIGSHIIKKTKWGSREQQEKFAFISFFQNISLKKDEYVLISSEKLLNDSNYSDSEKEHIRNHALESARLVSGIDKVPFGAATVIKQHHGSNKGVGLSSLYLSISPLAIVFLFAEEWANLVFKYEDLTKRPSKEEIIRMLHKKYNMAGFNKILPILHTLEF